MGLAVKLSKSDIARAEKIMANEMLNELDYESIFGAIVYTILSQRELFATQVKKYYQLKDEGLMSPHMFLCNPTRVYDIVKGMSLHEQKMVRLILCAEQYSKSGIHTKLMHCANKTRQQQIDIRREFVRTHHGISYKTASLIMNKCGATKLATLDVWVTRAMDVDFTTSESRYIEIEELMMKDARKYGVSLALYSAALWGKLSSYKDNVNINRTAKQTKLKEYPRRKKVVR